MSWRQVRVAGVSGELGDQRLDLLLEFGDLAIALGDLVIALGQIRVELGHASNDLRVLVGADGARMTARASSSRRTGWMMPCVGAGSRSRSMASGNAGLSGALSLTSTTGWTGI